MSLKWLSAEEPLVDQLTVKPGETKHVMTAYFQTAELVDHNAMVHLVLSTGHIMRMPLYYHVYEDVVKFLPSIVDFGVVPLNFDAITLPVSLKIRNGGHHKIAQLYLDGVYLPLNDMRLDFQMGEWNTMKIRAKDSTVTTWLNGVEMIQIDDEKIGEGKAVISAGVRDVFASRKQENYISQPNFYLYNNSIRGRFFVLGVSYSFGKGEAMTYSGGRRH